MSVSSGGYQACSLKLGLLIRGRYDSLLQKGTQPVLTVNAVLWLPLKFISAVVLNTADKSSNKVDFFCSPSKLTKFKKISGKT